MKLLPVLVLCLALPALAQTQTRSTQVYRCGPDGRDLRDSPCPNDQPQAGGSTLNYDDPSAADSKAARQRHLAEAKQAAALAAARRASEVEARRGRNQVGLIDTLPPPAAPASGPQVTTLKPPKTNRPQKPAAGANTGR